MAVYAFSDIKNLKKGKYKKSISNIFLFYWGGKNE